MPQFTKFAAVPAMVAALSLVVTPAAAAEVRLNAPRSATAIQHKLFNPAEAQTYSNHRYYRYHHRRGPDAGDIIAGVLIIGAIAAVADAAIRDDDDRRYRDNRYPETRRDDARWNNRGWDDSRGIDRAMDMCIDEIERDRRIENVDRANRTAGGWEIEGTVERGDSFRCVIGTDGRIEAIDFGQRGAGYEPQDDDRYDGDYARTPARDADDRQWDDELYAAEWARVERSGSARAEASREDYPAEPTEDESTVDGDLDVGTGYPGAGV